MTPNKEEAAEPVAYAEHDGDQWYLYWPDTNGTYEHIRDFPDLHGGITKLFAAPPQPEFRACVAHFEDGNFSQMVLEDCPTVTGYPSVIVEPLYAMADREKIVGFQWHGKVPHPAGEVERMREALQWIMDSPGAHPMNMWRVAQDALRGDLS